MSHDRRPGLLTRAVVASLPLGGLCLPAAAADLVATRGGGIEMESGFSAAGRLLPGVALRARMFDERLDLTLRNLHGADLFSRDRVVTTPYMQDNDNWRREMGLQLDALRTDAVDVDISAGFSDLRLPYSRGQSMNIAEITAWERNRVADATLDVALLDGRLDYSSSLFWSDYTLSFTEDSAQSGQGEAVSGRGQWHRLEAELLRGPGLSLSTYGLYRSIDPGFRSRRDSRVTVYDAAGEKRRIGGQPIVAATRESARDIAKAFRTGTYWQPGQNELAGSLLELGATAAYGRLEMAGYGKREAASWREGSGSETRALKGLARLDLFPVDLAAWYKGETEAATRDREIGGRIGLSVSGTLADLDYRPSGLFAVLVPDYLSVGGAWGRVASSEDAGSAGQRRDITVDLDWEWDNAVTNASISRTAYDGGSDALGAPASRDWSFDASHTLFADTWDLTLYLSLNEFAEDAPGARARDLYLGGGLSFWLGMDRLPDFTAAFDYNRFTAALPDEGYESRYRDWDLQLSLDFSKFVLSQARRGTAFLKLSYRAQAITEAESGLPRSSSLEHAAVLSFATRF